MDNTNEFTIVVKDSEWEKILTYVDLVDKEIAAFGYVTPHAEGYMLVDEVFLVPQEVSGAEVDFTTRGLTYAVEKSIEDGRPQDLRFLMHSHVNMQAFWSATDEDMIEKLGSTGAPWYVNLVMNKKGEHKCRLDVFDAGIPGLSHIRDINLPIMPEGSLAIREDVVAEIDKFVTLQKVKPFTFHDNNNKKKKGSDKHPPKKKDKKKLEPTDDGFYGMLHDDDIDEAFDMYVEAEKHGWIVCEHDGFAQFYDDHGDHKGSCVELSTWDLAWK